MKKLFFIALATVAIGGAFASNTTAVRETGEFYSENAEEIDIICNEGERLCSAVYTEAWDKPASDLSRQEVELDEFSHN